MARVRATQPLHLKPSAAFYPRALLPGDPGRALAIAQDQLVEPRMFNHRRGLWGYSGIAGDGDGLLIQSTGMGGPSAAIICEELIGLGCETLIRVGTCGAVAPAVALGDMIVVTEVIASDGAGRRLGKVDRLSADLDLTERLVDAAGTHSAHAGPCASVDLFYDPSGADDIAATRAAGALAIEMEAAAIFAVARRHDVRVACVLAVTDVLNQGPDRARMDDESISEIGLVLGRVATAALAS